MGKNKKKQFHLTWAYPSATVFCPKEKQEQDMDVCANCKKFQQVVTVEDMSHKKNKKVFVVECRYRLYC